MSQFFKGERFFKSDVYLAQPYNPNKIPIVFVHGTFSSPAWWAEMMNTLRADSLLSQKYQMWYYLYDSGRRLYRSGHNLRDSLLQRIKEFDQDGTSPALHQMVVIGHSQGGLLTKMTAVDTGDRFIRLATNKPLDELDLTEAQRETIKKRAILKPLPFVKRVVFIATPHRGSYLAKGWVRNLAHRFRSLPKKVLQVPASVQEAVAAAGVSEETIKELMNGTSLDGMSPDNKALLTFAEIPIDEGIVAHSIIAIDSDKEPPEGDDGVVEYTSAHVDYAESEYIVRSGHSCQNHPLVIEEVRRILLQHLKPQDPSLAKP